jgi:DNA-binding beta-propeller fold protein YncE
MTDQRAPRFFESDLRRYLELRAEVVATRAGNADEAAAEVAQRLGLLPRRRRRIGLLRLAVTLALLVALLAAALYLVGRQRETYMPDQPRVTAVLRGSPWAVATAEGSVWVGTYQEPVIFRLDPASGAVLAEIPTGRTVCGQFETGFGYLWFSDCGGLWLSRLDPVTLKIDRLAGYGTDRVAIGDGSVWVPHDGAVERLDPVTLDTLARIPVPGSGLVTHGSGAVWLSDADGGAVYRIDPQSEQVVATIRWNVPGGQPYPVHLVAFDEAVWVVDEGALRIYRIDPATNTATAVPLELGPIDGTGFGDHPIAAGAGGLWVRESETSIARFDPTTLAVVERQPTDAIGGGAFAVTEQAIWFANLKGDSVVGVRRP